MGLIFSLAALLLAIGAVMSTIYQQRIATSTRDRELAFQAAEAALRDAEMALMCRVYTSTDALGQCIGGADFPSTPACMPGCDGEQASKRFAVGFNSYDAAKGLCPFGFCTTQSEPGTEAASNKPVWEHVDWSKEKDTEPTLERSTVPIGYFTHHPAYEKGEVVPGVVAQPRFLIEAVPPKCDPKEKYCGYRITARGWGSKDSVVTLQEFFRPW